MTTPTEVAEIAAGLTKAQRQAIRNARWYHPGGQDPICLVDFTDPWTAPVAQMFTLHVDVLTPLGLALKAHLEQNP